MLKRVIKLNGEKLTEIATKIDFREGDKLQIRDKEYVVNQVTYKSINGDLGVGYAYVDYMEIDVEEVVNSTEDAGTTDSTEDNTSTDTNTDEINDTSEGGTNE